MIMKKNKLRVLDLFSGIGGFSLGLEKTGGFETAAFCEIDKAAQSVLKKHWSNVPIFEDVSTLKAKDLDGSIDVICGGFPCQDISLAGKGAGLAGERSGLWFEFHRLIQEIQPKWVIAENVSALRSRGLDEVLRSLAEIGYDAEWHCIPASAIGAKHKRDRIWIIAYPREQRCEQRSSDREERHVLSNQVGNASEGQSEREGRECGSSSASEADSSRLLANTPSLGSSGQGTLGQSIYPETLINREAVESQHGRVQHFWEVEPNVGRVVDGLSRGVDKPRQQRLKQLGNAVVPQIPELIGNAILRTNSL